ncbi:phage putative helicase [Salmonella phage SPFM8]|nr:phage putative helicase [Salmonella phage SPFM8]
MGEESYHYTVIPFQDVGILPWDCNGHSFLEVQRGKHRTIIDTNSCSSLDNEADGEMYFNKRVVLKALDPVGFCKNLPGRGLYEVVRNRGFLIAPHQISPEGKRGNGIAGSDIKEIYRIARNIHGYHVVGIRADYLGTISKAGHTNSDFKVHYINDLILDLRRRSDYLCGKIRANGWDYVFQKQQMTIAQDATAEEKLAHTTAIDVNLAYGYQALYGHFEGQVPADVKGTLQPIILDLSLENELLFSLLLSLSIPIFNTPEKVINKGITEELWLMPALPFNCKSKAAGNGLQTGWKAINQMLGCGELVTDNRAPFVKVFDSINKLKEALSTFGERSHNKIPSLVAFGALNGTETRVDLNTAVLEYYFQLRQCLQSVELKTKMGRDDLPEEEDKRTEHLNRQLSHLKLATTQVRPLYDTITKFLDIITSIIDGGMEYDHASVMKRKLPEYAEDGEERFALIEIKESMLTDPSKDHDVIRKVLMQIGCSMNSKMMLITALAALYTEPLYLC